MGRNRVFVTVITTLMSADPLIHGDGNKIQYKISYGHELENQNLIFKIQMVGDGYIKGKQAPSYSDKDFDRIVRIKEILRREYKTMDHRLRDIELSEEEVNQRIEKLESKS